MYAVSNNLQNSVIHWNERWECWENEPALLFWPTC